MVGSNPANFAGLGMNLQDHLEIYLQHKCLQPVTLYGAQHYPKRLLVGMQWFLSQTGQCASSHMESGGFVRTSPDMSHPNIQFHFLPSVVIEHGRVAPSFECFQVKLAFSPVFFWVGERGFKMFLCTPFSRMS